MNMIDLMERFPTHEKAVEILEQMRWGDKIKCAYCKSENTNTYMAKGRKRHFCNTCIKSFTVTVGTIFHSTKVPLHKWFILIALMLNAKKGLSACQASRDLGMRRPTVWAMMQKIRKAMADNGSDELLSGIIEMDECYIGGKPRKQAKPKKDDKDDDDNFLFPPISKRGRGTKKEAVVSMISRNGKVKAKLVRKSVNVEKSILITDE